jgi:hypothetical protein
MSKDSRISAGDMNTGSNTAYLRVNSTLSVQPREATTMKANNIACRTEIVKFLFMIKWI